MIDVIQNFANNRRKKQDLFYNDWKTINNFGNKHVNFISEHLISIILKKKNKTNKNHPLIFQILS